MGYTTAAEVAAWLKLDNADDPNLVSAVAAANAVATRYLGDSAGQDEAGRAGAMMLAARLYRRRNSPDGVQAITDSGAAYVARTDPDVARLLRIDQYAVPKVG